jgi:ribosomal protein S18 acetylase RimI-like enzyme
VSELEVLRALAIEIYEATFANANSPENMQRYLREAFDRQQMLKEWEEPDAGYWGAYEANQLVGYLRLRKNTEVDTWLGHSHLEIQRLYVHMAHQGKGVADQLMRHALAEAKRLGKEWIWLGVWEKNSRAQRFYERWGFEKFSEHVFWMGDDPQTDWLLKKRMI